MRMDSVMSELTEKVTNIIMDECGWELVTYGEGHDKARELIALVTEACVKSVSELYLSEADKWTHSQDNDEAIDNAIRAIRALGEVKE